jgi:hypothetical protein
MERREAGRQGAPVGLLHPTGDPSQRVVDGLPRFQPNLSSLRRGVDEDGPAISTIPPPLDPAAFFESVDEGRHAGRGEPEVAGKLPHGARRGSGTQVERGQLRPGQVSRPERAHLSALQQEKRLAEAADQRLDRRVLQRGGPHEERDRGGAAHGSIIKKSYITISKQLR